MTGGKPLKEVGAQQPDERDVAHSSRELRRLADGNILNSGVGKGHKAVTGYVKVRSEYRG